MINLLSLLYDLLKDILRFILKRFKKPNPTELLKQRQILRSEFERHLNKNKTELIFGEAIIRDVSRIDIYPNYNDGKKSISPWFKVEVKGLYHRGLEVIIGIDSIFYNENLCQWCYATNDENDNINAFLVGQIPFDVIRGVEWNGDEYYRCPHIYCEFIKKNKQPYENLIYYELQGSGEYRYFIKIVELNDIIKNHKHPHRIGV
ncbi:MAG: hypothetical protein ABFD00_07160 [Chloroherpetonaceae bacterium]